MSHPPVPSRAHLIEVGPRDGFQSETKFIPTAMKIEIIEALVASGIKRIQVTSFVNPRRVPQMADADQICESLSKQPDVIYSGLVLNERGVRRAIDAGINGVDTSISTSDTHSRKNAGCSLQEARHKLGNMIRLGKQANLHVRAGLQNVWGCNFEGVIPLERIVAMVEEMMAAGADMISLADSTGMATPKGIRKTLKLVADIVGDVPIVLHLHDTRGLGLANVAEATRWGVTHFDAAFGGLGGCPFIPGATGNIATEDAINLLEGLGMETGVDMAGVALCSEKMAQFLNRELPGRMYRLINKTPALA